MLKAKNILIIFMINYLLILLTCCLIEIICVGNNAQQAQLLMRTAADMALEQVQATDNFFVTGGGYLLNNSTSYKLTVNNGQKFEKVPLFSSFSGFGDSKSEIERIYNYIYPSNKIASFVSDNPGVLSPGFIAGVTHTKDNSMIDVPDTDSPFVIPEIYTNWYYVPKLYQIGLEKGVRNDSYIDSFNGIAGVARTLDINEIIKTYELQQSKKQTNINGEAGNYYLTPLSLGVTYINEDLLQALFMNNLDLLMRCKYMQREDYNLQSSECGNGILKGAFYPELVDTETLKLQNPINNGSFSLLRGNQHIGNSGATCFYQGTVKPKIEYVVLDMYSDEANEILQYVISPKFTRNTADSSFFNNNDEAQEYQGQKVTGTLLKKIDKESINSYKKIVGVEHINDTVLDHKPIIVAKVTFYADFIIPYSTVSLREMRGREIDDSISGRDIFNPFSNTAGTDGNNSIKGNYVDLQIKVDNVEKNKVYTSDYTNNRNNFNSDAMTYTTFFAVIP